MLKFAIEELISLHDTFNPDVPYDFFELSEDIDITKRELNYIFNRNKRKMSKREKKTHDFWSKELLDLVSNEYYDNKPYITVPHIAKEPNYKTLHQNTANYYDKKDNKKDNK